MSETGWRPDCPIDARPLRIVITGRPNVGKSTLFNRFLGKRRAITDPTPGVTRDPIEAAWTFRERNFTLVDTGGFTLAREGLDKDVTRRCLEHVQKADLILLVVEAEGLTPEDREFAERLRPYTSKILLVANKTDSEYREGLLEDVFSLGFAGPIAVSAEHARNLDVLADAIWDRVGELPVTPRTEGEGSVRREDADVVRIAVLGKPNTGKSSLINQLASKESSLVSDVPGTTRDVIEDTFVFKNRKFVMFDTAGIRRKKKVTTSLEYYSVNRAVSIIEEVEIVILLIDFQEGLTDQDKKIADLAAQKGRGVIVALNKWDLRKGIPNEFEALKDRINFVFPVLHFAPILPLSAKTGEGIDKLLNMCIKMHGELHQRIETGPLNKALQEWEARYAAPSRGKNVRVRYMAQTTTFPVRFVLFTNKKKFFPREYVLYVKNRLRESFDLQHIPIEVDVRES